MVEMRARVYTLHIRLSFYRKTGEDSPSALRKYNTGLFGTLFDVDRIGSLFFGVAVEHGVLLMGIHSVYFFSSDMDILTGHAIFLNDHRCIVAGLNGGVY